MSKAVTNSHFFPQLVSLREVTQIKAGGIIDSKAPYYLSLSIMQNATLVLSFVLFVALFT